MGGAQIAAAGSRVDSQSLIAVRQDCQRYLQHQTRAEAPASVAVLEMIGQPAGYRQAGRPGGLSRARSRDCGDTQGNGKPRMCFSLGGGSAWTLEVARNAAYGVDQLPARRAIAVECGDGFIVARRLREMHPAIGMTHSQRMPAPGGDAGACRHAGSGGRQSGAGEAATAHRTFERGDRSPSMR